MTAAEYTYRYLAYADELHDPMARIVTYSERAAHGRDWVSFGDDSKIYWDYYNMSWMVA